MTRAHRLTQSPAAYSSRNVSQVESYYTRKDLCLCCCCCCRWYFCPEDIQRCSHVHSCHHRNPSSFLDNTVKTGLCNERKLNGNGSDTNLRGSTHMLWTVNDNLSGNNPCACAVVNAVTLHIFTCSAPPATRSFSTVRARALASSSLDNSADSM